MTVGISLTNGLEAVVITDSRVSGGTRQSDSVNKMGFFSADRYNGVIYGAGNGNVIEGVTRYAKKIQGESLDGYVASVHQMLQQREQDLHSQTILSNRRTIDLKSKHIGSKAERQKYVEQETAKAITEYEQYLRNPQNATQFIVVGYDAQNKRIRMHVIDSRSPAEYFMHHIELGSGADGAHMYLSNALQGLSMKDLSAQDLTFFAVNAYTSANINIGVGGTPRVAVISQKGAHALPVEQARVMANLSGAFLASINPELTTNRVRDHIGKILKKKGSGKVARDLCIPVHVLKSMTIPYGSWQERANDANFEIHKKSE